jgi:hypothetical protein
MKNFILQRILNILIAFDQLVYTVVTLGYGMPDETLSAAAWRTEQLDRFGGKLFRPLIDMLFWFDPEHCKGAHESELLRAYLRSRVNQPAALVVNPVVVQPK